MAIKIDVDITQLTPGLTKREFVRACGFSVGAKGRFKPEIIKVIELAEAKGYEFAKPVTAEKVTAAVGQKEIDSEAFHQWELSKGYTESERRWPVVRINEFVKENPDFKRRETVVKTERKAGEPKVQIAPLPAYDAKAARKWAIAEGIDVPERGRLPRWVAEKFIASHKDAGTDVPVAESETTNNFGPAAPRVKFEEWYEGTDSKGDTVRKFWKDADVVSGYSIAYVPGDVFAVSPNDTDELVPLYPVGA
jgi:hypothetical protein